MSTMRDWWIGAPVLLVVPLDGGGPPPAAPGRRGGAQRRLRRPVRGRVRPPLPRPAAGRAEAETLGAGGLSAREELLAVSTLLLVLGLYGVQFLGALLALFLGVASVSPEIDSGILHAVLARPLSRLNACSAASSPWPSCSAIPRCS